MNTLAARRDDTERCYRAAASWPWLQQLANARTVAADADGKDGAVADLDEESLSSEFNGRCGFASNKGQANSFMGWSWVVENLKGIILSRMNHSVFYRIFFSLLESALLLLQKVQLHYYVCQ